MSLPPTTDMNDGNETFPSDKETQQQSHINNKYKNGSGNNEQTTKNVNIQPISFLCNTSSGRDDIIGRMNKSNNEYNAFNIESKILNEDLKPSKSTPNTNNNNHISDVEKSKERHSTTFIKNNTLLEDTPQLEKNMPDWQMDYKNDISIINLNTGSLEYENYNPDLIVDSTTCIHKKDAEFVNDDYAPTSNSITAIKSLYNTTSNPFLSLNNSTAPISNSSPDNNIESGQILSEDTAVYLTNNFQLTNDTPQLPTSATTMYPQRTNFSRDGRLDASQSNNNGSNILNTPTLDDRQNKYGNDTIDTNSATITTEHYNKYPPPQQKQPSDNVDKFKKDRNNGDDLSHKPTGYIGFKGVTFNSNVRPKTEKIIRYLSIYSPFINGFLVTSIVYIFTFIGPIKYSDSSLFNYKTSISLFWLIPLPLSLFNLIGLITPFKTDSERYDRKRNKPRRFDNLYVVIVTRGDNKDTIKRSSIVHKNLESIPKVRVHFLTDEPYYFEDVNCFTCPSSFKCNSKYKSRALEWYRRIQKLTKYDWVLHLDEETVVDRYTILRCIEFIKYSPHLTGQGVILYNQYNFWNKWLYTAADSSRVGDDLGRFHLQYEILHGALFGAHGSFLLNNGTVENDITWELTSLTEDYQFAVNSRMKGYTCGQIDGIVREQSPQKLLDFLKQRRRWFAGIIRIKLLSAKFLAIVWFLSSISIPISIIALYIGFVYPETIPRWQAFVINLNTSIVIVIMLNGSAIQAYDANMSFFRGLLQVIITLFFMPLSCAIESTSIAYAVLRPPIRFDVIKK